MHFHLSTLSSKVCRKIVVEFWASFIRYCSEFHLVDWASPVCQHEPIHPAKSSIPTASFAKMLVFLNAQRAEAFRDGHWQFERADPKWRSLHYIAGGHYYATEEALQIGEQ